MSRSLAALVVSLPLPFSPSRPQRRLPVGVGGGGPGFSISIGPRYGYCGYGYRPYGYYGYPYGYYRPYAYYGYPSLRILRWWVPSILAWSLETSLAALALAR